MQALGSLLYLSLPPARVSTWQGPVGRAAAARAGGPGAAAAAGRAGHHPVPAGCQRAGAGALCVAVVVLGSRLQVPADARMPLVPQALSAPPSNRCSRQPTAFWSNPASSAGDERVQRRGLAASCWHLRLLPPTQPRPTSQEVSGYIDVGARLAGDEAGMAAVFAGQARLAPRRGDLSCYNWAACRLDSACSPNFEVGGCLGLELAGRGPQPEHSWRARCLRAREAAHMRGWERVPLAPPPRRRVRRWWPTPPPAWPSRAGETARWGRGGVDGGRGEGWMEAASAAPAAEAAGLGACFAPPAPLASTRRPPATLPARPVPQVIVVDPAAPSPGDYTTRTSAAGARAGRAGGAALPPPRPAAGSGPPLSASAAGRRAPAAAPDRSRAFSRPHPLSRRRGADGRVPSHASFNSTNAARPPKLTRPARAEVQTDEYAQAVLFDHVLSRRT